MPTGTYTLTIAGANEDNAVTGDLDIRRDVTIVGAGAATTIVEAGPSAAAGIDRVFHVMSNGLVGSLLPRDLTVRHGNASVGGGNGGGILAQGPVSLERVQVTANQGGTGGLRIEADTSVSGSTIGGNAATSAGGGGVQISAEAITVALTNVTIAGNTAVAGSGGGIGQGAPAATTLNNVTIVGNSSVGGGGIGVAALGGAVAARNSIVANNTATSASPNCAGNVDSLGNNLVFGGADTCDFSAGLGDVVNTGDPRLGALQSNGGPTQTMALLPGSAAIDAGNPGAPGTGGNTCAAIDQRGQSRVDGNNNGTVRCDIGAFEQVPLPIDLAVALTDGIAAPVPGASLTYTLTVTNPGTVAVANVQVAGTFPDPLTGVAWM